MSDQSFVECDACRAKPGSPTLCAGCRANRRTIGDLQASERHLREVIDQIKRQAHKMDAILNGPPK